MAIYCTFNSPMTTSCYYLPEVNASFQVTLPTSRRSFPELQPSNSMVLSKLYKWYNLLRLQQSLTLRVLTQYQHNKTILCPRKFAAILITCEIQTVRKEGSAGLSHSTLLVVPHQLWATPGPTVLPSSTWTEESLFPVIHISTLGADDFPQDCPRSYEQKATSVQKEYQRRE